MDAFADGGDGGLGEGEADFVAGDVARGGAGVAVGAGDVEDAAIETAVEEGAVGAGVEDGGQGVSRGRVCDHPPGHPS